MQRACLPPADYTSTTLLPSSNSRQHHARVTDPRRPIASSFFGAYDRSPDHTTTSPTARCARLLSYNTKHCCSYRCDSDNRQQQQRSSAEGVLPPADHPLLRFQDRSSRGSCSARYRCILWYHTMRMLVACSVRCWGAFF